jgi:hypothetical protein
MLAARELREGGDGYWWCVSARKRRDAVILGWEVLGIWRVRIGAEVWFGCENIGGGEWG